MQNDEKNHEEEKYIETPQNNILQMLAYTMRI